MNVALEVLTDSLREAGLDEACIARMVAVIDEEEVEALSDAQARATELKENLDELQTAHVALDQMYQELTANVEVARVVLRKLSESANTCFAGKCKHLPCEAERALRELE